MNPAVVAFGVATNTINSASKIMSNAKLAANAFDTLTRDPQNNYENTIV